MRMATGFWAGGSLYLIADHMNQLLFTLILLPSIFGTFAEESLCNSLKPQCPLAKAWEGQLLDS